MLQDGGFDYVIGYGENINVPTIDIISRRSPSSGTSWDDVDLQDLMTMTRRAR